LLNQTIIPMKTIKMLLAIAAILVSSISTYAQQVDLTRGDLSILKEENSINIEFTYDKMTVGDDGKEADYIKRKRTELNDKEKGSGEIWARKWEEDKATKFGPKFILGFTNLSKMTVSKDAKYTLLFNTKALEPGYSVGVSKRNAGIDGTVTIVETANPSKKLVVLSVERPGENMFRGAAFDAGSRIADAYYLSGQKVGKFISKNKD
ncbi:MAG TPA: hypothetical protein PK133_01250, partial [Ferruginibacter sp.]|nr:hypothetical protein [Ferruginibacter sp.]